MKKLENKKIKLGGQDSNYAQLISNLLVAVPEGGISSDEQRIRIAIAGIIDKGENEAYFFDEAQEKCLLEIEKNIKYSIIDKSLVDFADDLKSMEIVDLNKKETTTSKSSKK